MPNFEQSVRVILQTFATFVGFTLTLMITTTIGKTDFVAWCMMLALVALLLRYILGSAVHLNFMYVEKIGDPPLPRSRAPVLLIKDVAFLVLFGILAISVAQAAQLPDLTKFLRRSIVFLLAGFAWSPVDYAARWLWAKCRPAEHFEFDNVGAFWRIWVWLDLVHAAIALMLFWLIRSNPGARTFVGAAIVVVNIAFLLIDFTKMIEATRPPAPAAPAA